MKKEIEKTEKLSEEVEIKTRYIVEKILDELGVKISLKGYKYWVTAVKMKLQNEYETMIQLYIDVARKHKTTASKAERAMRHAYEDLRPKIKEYFNLNYNINNGIFLECLTREAKLFVKRKKMSNERRY